MPRTTVPAFAIVLGILAGIGALCCGVGAVMTVTGNHRDRSGPAVAVAAPVEPPAFDQAAFDKYWADNVSDDVQATVTSVDWSGSMLTAHTKLYADGDAVLPATDACTALGGFWLFTGRDFHSVRVLDGADQILVSRHTITDNCTWRR